MRIFTIDLHQAHPIPPESSRIQGTVHDQSRKGVHHDSEPTGRASPWCFLSPMVTGWDVSMYYLIWPAIMGAKGAVWVFRRITVFWSQVFSPLSIYMLDSWQQIAKPAMRVAGNRCTCTALRSFFRFLAWCFRKFWRKRVKILKYCTKAWEFLASQIKESKILPVQLKLQFTFGYWLVNDSGPPTNLVMSIRFIRLSQHRGSMLWLNRFLHDLMDMKRWSCPICIHCSQTQKAGSCGLSFPNPKFTKSVYNYSILLVIPAFLDLHYSNSMTCPRYVQYSSPMCIHVGKFVDKHIWPFSR